MIANFLPYVLRFILASFGGVLKRRHDCKFPPLCTSFCTPRSEICFQHGTLSHPLRGWRHKFKWGRAKARSNRRMEACPQMLTYLYVRCALGQALPVRGTSAVIPQNFPPLSASGTGNEGQSAMNGHLYYPSPWRA